MSDLDSHNTTETQFEAQLRTSILHAFPWLPSRGITHQDSFTFKVGHADVVVNAQPRTSVRARADVLVSFQGKPLAVFELKRPKEKLTEDDNQQGLSYARMLHPRPPLVVISNSEVVRFLATDTGEPWLPETKGEESLATLIDRGVRVAKADLKNAVDTLMGFNPDIWVQAIRQISDEGLREMTGGWDEPLLPFAEDFLLPRRATASLLHALSQQSRLLSLEGGPLSGKSSVLRELCLQTSALENLVVFYLDAQADVPLFERLALILSDALEWPIEGEEAQRWLRGVSRANGPTLVIAVDNLQSSNRSMWRSIETVTSNLFGPNVKIVLALDDAVADQAFMSNNKISQSALGRRSRRLELAPLDEEEFTAAEHVFAKHRITFVSGAQHSSTLRTPWLLRAITAEAVTAPEHQNLALVAALSPVPGLEILEYARSRFDVTRSPLNHYRELAQAILEDGQDSSRSYQLKLELMQAFVVRRTVALKHLSGDELRAMMEAGLIREARSSSGENIYVARIPELMASELSNLFVERIAADARKNPEEASDWLCGAAANMLLGDLIAADALLTAAHRHRAVSLQLIARLRGREPVAKPLAPGSHSATILPGVGLVDVVVREDGAMVLRHRRGETVIDPEEDGVGTTYSDMHPYQILSYLAGYPIAVEFDQVDGAPRLDPDLLIAVGSLPLVMQGSNSNSVTNSLLTHSFGNNLTTVCHRAGIVEQITWSLVSFFGREPPAMRQQFLDEALAEGGPAILARLDLALRQSASSADRELAAWAQNVRATILRPRLNEQLAGYLH
ncbi:type I restriction enzyme HsdR N-terminal domain-containing protein [Rhizobium ruizarguesonis]|uniref:type I restriction enzyme HsdR N-terminal domain-containing protein n=1 Tax=Rhizobium ruizarguesonis TaxID=2081791 RepID=UPI00102FDB82|nr:type I restriction enzyme HsdR N-terminal domain-containing protein [Rhizobium ruizarguesonis]TBD47123.1 hypothetical protein ELH17_08520 [Rhizobium ruizarguesonis]